MKKSNEYMNEEGYCFMGAVFEVYNEQGGGLAEEIYQESLELELEDQAIPYRPKEGLVVYYKGRPLKKRYIPDLLVYRGILVELKSVKELLPEHEAQLLNYMRITRNPLGYLINFGQLGGVQWKRFILKAFVPS